MPCRLVAPVLEEIAEEQADRLIVAKLNVNENPATADTYQARAIPLMGMLSGGIAVPVVEPSDRALQFAAGSGKGVTSVHHQVRCCSAAPVDRLGLSAHEPLVPPMPGRSGQAVLRSWSERR